MMMPMITSMFATDLAFSSAGSAMAANQASMGLANRVTGNESPAEVAFLGSMDKALALQSAQAGTNYQVAMALQSAAQEAKRKRAEHQQTNLQNGVIFG
jgi:hypothetical protein